MGSEEEPKKNDGHENEEHENEEPSKFINFIQYIPLAHREA